MTFKKRLQGALDGSIEYSSGAWDEVCVDADDLAKALDVLDEFDRIRSMILDSIVLDSALEGDE